MAKINLKLHEKPGGTIRKGKEDSENKQSYFDKFEHETLAIDTSRILYI